MKRVFLFFPSFLFLLWGVSGCENKTLEEQEHEIQRFYGTVTDVETGQTLTGVTIEMDNKPPLTTVTNPFGFYEIIIQDPRYLSYYIRAKKDGYSSYEYRIQLQADATSFEHNFEMEIGKAYLDIRSAYGADISFLNFEEDKNTLTFYIVKSGEGILDWNISYDADWIYSVEPQSGKLNKGSDGSNKAKALITVTINREKLNNLINTTELTITSNDYYNQTKKMILRAEKDGDYSILEDIGIMVQRDDMGYFSHTDAEAVCTVSTVGGFSDWRLPTFAELEALYVRREEIGNFLETSYWTSTEYYYEGSGYYYTIDFRKATYNGWNTIDKVFRVRAVRSIR